MINNLVHQQSSYWAFMDLFYAFMWLGIVCLIGVWLLKSVKSKGPVAAH